MYIEPSTTIILLNNVPLDNSYKNTLYFKDEESQVSYFKSKSKHTLNNQTYQRVENKKCRVNVSAGLCYDCNYMMFQNTAYGAKWFYAFITNVEYISNSTCEIIYEIDYLQTWFPKCTLLPCFVEREHSLTDNIGDNILPEPVELGEYLYEEQEELTPLLNPMAVVMGVSVVGSGVAEGNTYDGVYSGVKYYCFNANDTETIDNFLSTFVTTPDSVVCMYMCPVIVCAEGVIEDGSATVLEKTDKGWSTSLEILKVSDDHFGYYLPKNNKLYTYPYNFLHVDNNNGNSLELRYEFFKGNPKVKIDACLSMPVKVSCRPSDYKGVVGGLNTEIISLENYPMCSWNMDSYKVWLAQNLAPRAIKLASNVATSTLGAMGNGRIGNLAQISGLHSGVNNVTNMLADSYTASIQADICKGSINNGNVNVSHKMQNFYTSRCHISGDFARAIDDFFTMYGYACKRIKTPNINSRPHWNYVKTSDCSIVGNAPADDIAKIKKLFDNGITFWKNASEVGNYSLDNSPK